MMKSIKAPIDKCGRVTLPIQYRKKLGIEKYDKVEIEFKGNGIFIYKLTEKDILKSKLDDVMLAVGECKEIDPEEVATLVSILSKLVKEGAE